MCFADLRFGLLQRCRIAVCCAGAFVVMWGTPPTDTSGCFRQETVSAPESATRSTLEDVVREAFRETHQGWSSDEVIIRDELNRDFIERCRQSLPAAAEKDLNWTLLNLRKAGKLDTRATQFDYQSYDDVLHVAEMAARSLQDRTKQSIDAVMADPQLRREFDQVARSIDPDVDVYPIRKCALRLRKARELRPELITRIADWDRQVLEFTASDAAHDPTIIPELPGVYLFRDKSGYLYIGEAIDLRHRLQTHLDDSDRKSLSEYLTTQGAESISIEVHAFPADSRMKEIAVRRAYESELIRSRQPRFNVRP